MSKTGLLGINHLSRLSVLIYFLEARGCSSVVKHKSLIHGGIDSNPTITKKIFKRKKRRYTMFSISINLFYLIFNLFNQSSWFLDANWDFFLIFDQILSCQGFHFIESLSQLRTVLLIRTDPVFPSETANHVQHGNEYYPTTLDHGPGHRDSATASSCKELWLLRSNQKEGRQVEKLLQGMIVMQDSSTGRIIKAQPS